VRRNCGERTDSFIAAEAVKSCFCSGPARADHGTTRGNVMRSIARSVAPSVIISWPYSGLADRAAWWQDHHSFPLSTKCWRRKAEARKRDHSSRWALSVERKRHSSRFLRTDKISCLPLFLSLFLSNFLNCNPFAKPFACHTWVSCFASINWTNMLTTRHSAIDSDVPSRKREKCFISSLYTCYTFIRMSLKVKKDNL